MANSTKANQRVERALPSEEHASNDFSLMPRPEHIPSQFSFLLPRVHTPNDYSIIGHPRVHDEPQRSK